MSSKFFNFTGSHLKMQCSTLTAYINKGIYTQLPRHLRDLSKPYKGDKVQIRQDEAKLRHEQDYAA